MRRFMLAFICWTILFAGLLLPGGPFQVALSDAGMPQAGEVTFDSKEFISKGDKAFLESRYQDAISNYQSAINNLGGKLNKIKKAELYFKIGFSYGELNQWDKGIASYRNGMVLGAKIYYDTPIFSNKSAEKMKDEGVSLTFDGKYSLAIATLKKAEQLEPVNPSPSYELGWAHHKSDNPTTAIMYFKKAYKKDVLFLRPLGGLGKTYYVIKKPYECIFYYRLILMLYPDTKYKSIFEQRILEMKDMLVDR